jgi:hypothetical protein
MTDDKISSILVNADTSSQVDSQEEDEEEGVVRFQT